MMTLDEAIVHAREVASKLRNMTSVTNGKPYEECLECASEYEQLVKWLEELKRYKAQKVVIKVDRNNVYTLKKLLRHSQFGIAFPDGQYEVVPLVSGGPSDEEYKRDCKETADMLQIILDDAESYKYGASYNKEGVLLKHISLKGSFEWAISRAIDIIRGVSI